MDHVNFSKNRREILADLWEKPVLADFAPPPSKPADFRGGVPVLLPTTDASDPALGYSTVMLSGLRRRKVYAIRVGVKPTFVRKVKAFLLNVFQ